MPIFLYKKTHKDTGLKYLGKTIAGDPYAYPGSGVTWKVLNGKRVWVEVL